MITRDQWGADESLRYLDSPEWQQIIEKNKKLSQQPKTPQQEENIKKQRERTQLINKILTQEYGDFIQVEKEVIRYENNHELAWPIEKSQNIQGIVIHHTLGEYDDMYDAVRRIYKYHAISRQWWDIWYNFLIWENGEIFEWRSWGANAVAAHNKRNNKSTIWIAFIWDYSDKEINQQQNRSLEKLITYLVEEYNIDLNKKFYYHKECLSEGCDVPLESFQLDPIVWHRDAGHTSCPWDELYHQIDDLLLKLKIDLGFTKYNVEQVNKRLEKFSPEDLYTLLLDIHQKNQSHFSSNLYILEKMITDYIKAIQAPWVLDDSALSLNKQIKIKLSYSKNDYIQIDNGEEIFNITRKNSYLYVNGEKQKIIHIKPSQREYIELVSWDRKPSWDRTWVYNDNKFRWDIIVYVKDGDLVVVNKLKIEDYLKWLWEVSNGDNLEKAKTIIIAARSYAHWYTSQARKFPGEWYDGSDDPNVFQKYLWYSLELRSPRINQIVEDTKGLVISYNNKLIKPWYFSQSNWKTLSFYQYCLQNNPVTTCESIKDQYPYLQSVVDFWSQGVEKLWHGVWISGKWSSYLASNGWSGEMIIRYYLQGVDLVYLQ